MLFPRPCCAQAEKAQQVEQDQKCSFSPSSTFLRYHISPVPLPPFSFQSSLSPHHSPGYSFASAPPPLARVTSTYHGECSVLSPCCGACCLFAFAFVAGAGALLGLRLRLRASPAAPQ